MLKSFTRNYEDNSTEAGFQFTFYCDICNDGYKSSFIESSTYKKGQGLRGLSRGAGVLEVSGAEPRSIGIRSSAAGTSSPRVEDRSPSGRRSTSTPLEQAQNEAQRISTAATVPPVLCDADYNEDEGLCVDCAPRQEITWQVKGTPCDGTSTKRRAQPPSGTMCS
jgi:hypothetical protein